MEDKIHIFSHNYNHKYSEMIRYPRNSSLNFNRLIKTLARVPLGNFRIKMTSPVKVENKIRKKLLCTVTPLALHYSCSRSTMSVREHTRSCSTKRNGLQFTLLFASEMLQKINYLPKLISGTMMEICHTDKGKWPGFAYGSFVKASTYPGKSTATSFFGRKRIHKLPSVKRTKTTQFN